jgi:hypothetical protein
MNHDVTQEWSDVQKPSQQGIVCDVTENNKHFDVASRQTSGKFDVWRHDLFPTGAALGRWDIDYRSVSY